MTPLELQRITSKGGANFSVARQYAPRFQGFINDLEARGYAIDPQQSGGYNPRYISGTRTPSHHAYGRAIDINWTDNARGRPGKIPQELALELAQKHGLNWGGTWKNRDDMHFEVANGDPIPMGQRGLTSFAGLGAQPQPTTGATMAPRNQMPPLVSQMGQPGQPQQQQGGWNLYDALTNPLTMMGLSILGSPTRDVGQGIQTFQQGRAYDDRRAEMARQRMVEEQQQKAFQGAVAGAGDLGPMAPVIQSLGAEKGAPLLAELIQQRTAPPKQTDDQREYEMARSQGFQGSFMDYLTQIKKAGAQVTQLDMRQESAYDKELGTQLATEFVTANRAAAKATRDLANLRVMRTAIDDKNLYTGTGGDTIQGMKKAAETLFGVSVKGTASGEVVQNLASEIAVGNKEKLPGPMSDADRQFLVEMAPSLTKTPEGNRLIIELGMAHKEWEASKAKAVQEFARQNGGRLTAEVYSAIGDLDNQAAERFGGILAKLKSLGGMAPRSPTVGTPIDAYKNRYGLE